MAESEATTQFRELQKQYIEASSKLKQVRFRLAAWHALAGRMCWITQACSRRARAAAFSHQRPVGHASAADTRALLLRRWLCKAARANRSGSAAFSRWRSWTRFPRRATPTRAWAERASFGPSRQRARALTTAVCSRSFVHQAKPALVKELRDAVSNCDEELEKLKARALTRVHKYCAAPDAATLVGEQGAAGKPGGGHRKEHQGAAEDKRGARAADYGRAVAARACSMQQGRVQMRKAVCFNDARIPRSLVSASAGENPGPIKPAGEVTGGVYPARSQT